jgi:hypothetical protein
MNEIILAPCDAGYVQSCTGYKWWRHFYDFVQKTKSDKKNCWFWLDLEITKQYLNMLTNRRKRMKILVREDTGWPQTWPTTSSSTSADWHWVILDAQHLKKCEEKVKLYPTSTNYELLLSNTAGRIYWGVVVTPKLRWCGQNTYVDCGQNTYADCGQNIYSK